MTAEMIAAAIAALERVADEAARALVLVDDDAPSHAPCPDVETYRAHQTYHRQRRDGTWTCAACDVLAPSRAPTAAPSSIAVRPVNGQAPR